MQPITEPSRERKPSLHSLQPSIFNNLQIITFSNSGERACAVTALGTTLQTSRPYTSPSANSWYQLSTALIWNRDDAFGAASDIQTRSKQPRTYRRSDLGVGLHGAITPQTISLSAQTRKAERHLRGCRSCVLDPR